MNIRINGVSFDTDVLSTKPVPVEKVARGDILVIDRGYGAGAIAVLDRISDEDGIVFTGEHGEAFFDYGVTVNVVTGLAINDEEE